ncbi:MAG TPA: DciA family protein [Stellaceae bacterium]|nr:DciA family protein [Stellaceae bacterium]
MAVSESGERRKQMRAVGQELPQIAGRALGKRGLGEAHLLSDWASVVGPELAAETVPVKLAFPPGERRNGTLRLRVTSAAALAVQHREPQILERINGFLGYPAVRRLALLQGPLPSAAPARPPPPRPLSAEEARLLDRHLAQVPESGLKSALHKLGMAIARQRRG